MLHNSSFKVKIKNTLTGPLKQNIRWAPNSKSTFAEKKYLGEGSGRKGRFTIRTRRKTLPKMRNLKKFFSGNGYFENWFD